MIMLLKMEYSMSGNLLGMAGPDERSSSLSGLGGVTLTRRAALAGLPRVDIVQPQHSVAGIADVLCLRNHYCADVDARSVANRKSVHVVARSDKSTAVYLLN
jgi:hypothetical protein